MFSRLRERICREGESAAQTGRPGNNKHEKGIIRRFFPEGTDFSLVTEEQSAGTCKLFHIKC
jgi:hypothetical protein